MKKYVKTAIVLSSIAAACGLLIGLTNEVTAPIIKENAILREQKALEEIISGAEFNKVEITKNYDYITAIYEVNNLNMKARVYTLSGKNAYGSVELMAGVKFGGEVFKVVIMQNTESYASNVDEFIENTFSTSVSDFENIDVKCGATYGAKLVRDMLKEASEDYR